MIRCNGGVCSLVGGCKIAQTTQQRHGPSLSCGGRRARRRAAAAAAGGAYYDIYDTRAVAAAAAAGAGAVRQYSVVSGGGGGGLYDTSYGEDGCGALGVASVY
jgi:hypothetical protein